MSILFGEKESKANRQRLREAICAINKKEFKKGNIGSGGVIYFPEKIRKQFQANQDWDVAKREMVLSLYMSYACLDKIKNPDKKITELKEGLRGLLEKQRIKA